MDRHELLEYLKGVLSSPLFEADVYARPIFNRSQYGVVMVAPLLTPSGAAETVGEGGGEASPPPHTDADAPADATPSIVRPVDVVNFNKKVPR